MRCRVSGESGKLEESMTILRRDRTSATETTSSLTTAAIRVWAPWLGGGARGGGGAGPRCAGAGSALLEKPARLISTKPNQRVIVIDGQPQTSIGVVKPYTRTPIMSPTSSGGTSASARGYGRESPLIDAIAPPISPRFLNTTLARTATPGVTSPLRMPDCVTELTTAMHSSR